MHHFQFRFPINLDQYFIFGRHFLILTEPVEFSDLLFIKNLIVFKRWLYIEEVAEDRDKIREAFVRFVKPKKTIW